MDFDRAMFQLLVHTLKQLPYSLSLHGPHTAILYEAAPPEIYAQITWDSAWSAIDIQVDILLLATPPPDELWRSLMRINLMMEMGGIIFRPDTSALAFRLVVPVSNTSSSRQLIRSSVLSALLTAHEFRPILRHCIDGASSDTIALEAIKHV